MYISLQGLSTVLPNFHVSPSPVFSRHANRSISKLSHEQNSRD